MYENECGILMIYKRQCLSSFSVGCSCSSHSQSHQLSAVKELYTLTSAIEIWQVTMTDQVKYSQKLKGDKILVIGGSSGERAQLCRQNTPWNGNANFLPGIGASMPELTTIASSEPC
jgi:hypothetical protein